MVLWFKEHRKEAWNWICTALPIAFTFAFLIYYCIHPDLYTDDEEATISLFTSIRTLEILLLSGAIIAMWGVKVELSERLNRILSWIWFVLAPFAVYFSLLYLNATKYKIDFFALDKIALLLTFAFLYLVQGILFGITGSIRFSVMLYAIPVALIGIVNVFVIQFRSMAISAGDIFSIGAAASVAGEYTYTLDWYMVMEILFTFAICTVSLKLKRGRMMPLAARGAFLALFAILGSSYFYLCAHTTYLEDHDIRTTGFTHQLRYKKYDMLFTTLLTCFYLVVDKPEGYSLDAVHEIAAAYVNGDDDGDRDGDGAVTVDDGDGDGAVTVDDGDGDGAVTVDDGDGDSAVTVDDGDNDSDGAVTTATTVTPNVIVIMNESWADYTNIGVGLDLSEDCMPFIHSLTENTIKGNVYVSVFGSNTANSEYEFLTGNSMAFLPTSSVGFNFYVRGALPSLASQYSTLGYFTQAIHPYRGTNYRRYIVYPQIGFDEFIQRTDFRDVHFVRSYVSDQTLFERIISEYEETVDAGGQIFSYSVSIQNHGGYSSKSTRNLDTSITINNIGFSKIKSTVYVNLVKATDTAFAELVEYFETREEPVIILMYGDHQPSLEDGLYEYLIGDEEEITTEELMEKYKVPFVCWANYDIEEEEIEATSLNYLYSILADRLGLSMTGYQQYLLDLSEEIPVINSLGYWGADGNFYEIDDKTSPYYDLVNEYNILEYNCIFGGKNRYLEFFTLSEEE